MIKFKEYFSLKEDPDYVDINTKDLSVRVEYDEGEAYGFGFVNTDIIFTNHKPLEDLKEEQGKLIIGKHETHGQLKNKWLESLNRGVIKTVDRTLQIKEYDLSKPDQKMDLRRNTPFWTEVNGRIILSPAGRVWKNLKNEITKKRITLISFWHYEEKSKNANHDPTNFGAFTLTKFNELEVRPEHVIKVLEYLQIPKINWFDVYVEFMEDELEGPSEPRLTAADFINSYSSGKVEQPAPKTEIESDEKKERMEKVQAKMRKGAHGNELNPDFGSTIQAKKAEKSGFPSYAEYHARRNPYGESVDTHQKK